MVWSLNFDVWRTCGIHAGSVDGGVGGCCVNNNHV